MEPTKIRICTSCSKVSESNLQTAFPTANVIVGCVGACGGGIGNYFASVDTHFMKADSEENLITKIKEFDTEVDN